MPVRCAIMKQVMPKWQKMLDMCTEMAETLPDVRMIGWDLAYTEKGWIVIEGNAMSEVIGPQATMQKGIRTEIGELFAKKADFPLQ